jgi:hypothetical protein
LGVGAAGRRAGAAASAFGERAGTGAGAFGGAGAAPGGGGELNSSFASSVPLEHSLIKGTMPCASAIVRSLSGSGFVASTNANVPAYLSGASSVPEEGRQHGGLQRPSEGNPRQPEGNPKAISSRTECDLGALRLINVSLRQLRERRGSKHGAQEVMI